jgi:hypothetical protein
MANRVEKILVGLSPSVIFGYEKGQTGLELLAILGTPLRHELGGRKNHYHDDTCQTEQSAPVNLA